MNEQDRRGVHELVDHLFRHKAGQILSTLTRIFGTHNLDLAEEVVQEALYKALRRWPYHGVPDNPSAWIVQVARHLALDRLRREARIVDEQPAEGAVLAGESALDQAFDDPLGDDQLTMMFLCCHPILPRESQVALTLKTVGGFGAPEIARAFLALEATMSQRLLRARNRLREARLPFALPPADELPRRLDAVLDVLYLLFNEGYNACRGEDLVRHDLCAEAIRLCALLCNHPIGNRPKVHALLALMLLQASRLEARVDAGGSLLPLYAQDRSRWNREAIARGFYHLEQAAAGDEISEYHLQAGIAACHASATSDETTDWATILACYDDLAALNPSPVIALNRAIALARVQGAPAGIAQLERMIDTPALQRYYLLPATLGELYERNGQLDRATACYRDALDLTNNEVERHFLLRKLQSAEDRLWRDSRTDPPTTRPVRV